MAGEITFTPALLLKLKDAYKAAVVAGKTEFTFEGHLLIIEYSEYLIQHLDDAFNGKIEFGPDGSEIRKKP